MNLNQVTLPALNVAESVAFYRRIEALPASSEVVVYFEDAALDHKVKELQERGVRFTQEPRDEPWLWREARTQDPSGNVICLYWAGVNRLDPPWRIRQGEK
jgi:catechol 2,3-dioxygenase-like lactoylglutathione lyase family enzyme